MTGKFGWMIAVISAAFNLTFAGGYLASRAQRQESAVTDSPADRLPPRPVEALAEKLGLSESQLREYEQLQAETRGQAREIRQSLIETREVLMAQFDGPPGDAAAVRELVEIEAEHARQLRMLSAEHFRRLLNILDDRQREKLMELVAQRGGRWLGPGRPGGRPERMTEPERLEQRRSMRERIGEFGPIRARMIERFDLDGDGRLSEEEWSLARRAIDSARPMTQTQPERHRRRGE